MIYIKKFEKDNCYIVPVETFSYLHQNIVKIMNVK